MRYFFTCVVLLQLCVGNAQQDTLYLEPVSIQGDAVARFTTGATYKTISLSSGDQNLDQALAGEASIYFKTYGSQQLSSIAFRGTSASQTNVLWHGIPANYPTLGQSDFSQWPLWFLNDMALLPGSSGALLGSGAIGGSVLLDSEVEKSENGYGGESKVAVGSFGYHFAGLKAGYGGEKWFAKTKIFRSYIRNDFPYWLNGSRVNQHHASVLNMGVQQQVGYRTENHLFSLDAMITKNDREIQPSKLNRATENELATGNVRIALIHSFEQEKGSWTNTFAFLQNDQVFNCEDRTLSRQYSYMSIYWRELSDRLAFRAGSQINLFTANSKYYTDAFFDAQLAAFGSLEIKAADWWKVTANLRQSIYEGHRPFTPSVGQEFSFSVGSDDRITMGQNLAWGFRFPTLNDRYWVPGGNLDLKPESSLNLEGFFRWKSISLIDSDFALVSFTTFSENWIAWIPDARGIWSPVNFRDVQIYGIEASWQGQVYVGSVSQEFGLNYSYTKSLNKTEQNVGKQLPYTPVHLSGFSLRSTFRTWSGRLAANFTDRRFTTLDNTLIQSVPGFFLIDIGLERTIRLKLLRANCGLKVLNLLDADYENLNNMAMPGRNFQMYFSIKL